MTNYYQHNGTSYVHVSDYAAIEARLAEAEALLRDLCMGHSDDCACRGCKFAFRAANSATHRENERG